MNTVAIVGRPNVGKSALFNRLAGRKISIVHDQPGVTRDRLAGICKLGSKPFSIVDTGGIGSAVDADFTAQVRAEADIAMATADLIHFVVDGPAGLTPVDLELARLLRRMKAPLILVVNKIDHDKHGPLAAEFQRLGFAQSVSISAEHGRGITELVELTESLLPEIAEEAPVEVPPTKIAIVGRPNVGKSSLINAILQDRRTLVSDISGTTRDAVDIPFARKDVRYTLIDTAGIRPRGKVSNSVEVFSVMRSEKSIRRADLCALVLDSTAGVTAQDKKIAGMIQEAGRPCIVVANKWDLLEQDDERKKFERNFIEQTRAELFFLDYAPVLPVSAQTGENMSRLFKFIEQVRDDSHRRIGTGQLNRLLQAMLSAYPPPIRSGKRFKILYATQLERDPGEAIPIPTFTLFVNDPDVLPAAYRKYLEAQLREEARFLGLPVRLKLRGREKRYSG
jgi:GTP-binding protein